MVDYPDSEGHWELVSDIGTSEWDVYFVVGKGYMATNENQTDPCAWLTGKWRKLSNQFQGRLKDAMPSCKGSRYWADHKNLSKELIDDNFEDYRVTCLDCGRTWIEEGIDS